MQAHSQISLFLSPIIESGEKNKKRKLKNTTRHHVLHIAKGKAIDKAFSCLFASPEIPIVLVDDKLFQLLLRAIHPNLSIPTRSTLNARLWKIFHDAIKCNNEKVGLRCSLSMDVQHFKTNRWWVSWYCFWTKILYCDQGLLVASKCWLVTLQGMFVILFVSLFLNELERGYPITFYPIRHRSTS